MLFFNIRFDNNKLIFLLGLNPTETIKRRWAAKKAGTSVDLDDDSNLKTVTALTTLADSLVTNGNMEAYQLNAVQITKLIAEIDAPAGNNNNKGTIDMFG